VGLCLLLRTRIKADKPRVGRGVGSIKRGARKDLCCGLFTRSTYLTPSVFLIS